MFLFEMPMDSDVSVALSTAERITILGCPIDVLTMKETVERIDRAIQSGESLQHGVVDAGKLALMFEDRELSNAVCASDIINGEGQSLVWLSRLLPTRLRERVVGVELFERLLALAHQRGYRVFLFGAREEVVRAVVAKMSSKYGSGLIAGHRNGYFRADEERAIAAQISKSGAHMLFVGISSPIKEKFLYNHRDLLHTVSFRMGVGGGFDVVAGKITRAPLWIQKSCLEWFYRFLQEPRQKWRVEVLDSMKFVYYFGWEMIRGRVPIGITPRSSSSRGDARKRP